VILPAVDFKDIGHRDSKGLEGIVPGHRKKKLWSITTTTKIALRDHSDYRITKASFLKNKMK